MNKNFFEGKKVLVTGGTGFIGSHLVEKLLERGAVVTVFDKMTGGKIKFISHLKDKVQFIQGDCTNLMDAQKACKSQDIVMNLAAHVGGIEYNRFHQATMLRDNLLIASTMLEAARVTNVERFLVVSSACIYPSDAVIPTSETEGYKNEPEPTNGGYGWAKRVAEKLGFYYAQEFKMKIGIVRPYNAYGPRDQFDPASSHVIPALIKRVVDGENPVIVWGSGKQTRAFLFVDDLVEGMMKAVENYPVPDPINLGTDEEITIKELVEKIVKFSGVKTRIIFDTTKPDGSLRRNSDNTKAKEKIHFMASTSFDDGLKKTIDYYRSIATR
ncbi:MAG: NAD-dependent epimerase/dehydratase family protein [Microgenomates group bacterium]